MCTFILYLQLLEDEDVKLVQRKARRWYRQLWRWARQQARKTRRCVKGCRRVAPGDVLDPTPNRYVPMQHRT